MMALIRADVLKLRRRRALLAWSGVLTFGLVALFYGWRALQGVDPVGGARSLANLCEGLLLLGGVAAILLGATAGAGDASAGVLRDLVATGCPRVRLFLARIPAVLAVVVPLGVLTALSAGAGAIALAGQHGTAAVPTLTTVARDVLWLAGSYAFLAILACGVSSLLGTPTLSVGLLLGWSLAASPLLLGVRALGTVRWAIPPGALDRLQPDAQPLLRALSPTLAVLVLVAWCAGAATLGAWRTVSADV